MKWDWSDYLLAIIVSGVFMTLTTLVTIKVTASPPTPTSHLFMTGDVMCCRRDPGHEQHLQCGNMVLRAPANYVDTGKPCE